MASVFIHFLPAKLLAVSLFLSLCAATTSTAAVHPQSLRYDRSKKMGEAN